MVLVAWLFHLVPLSSPAEFLVLGFILGQLVLCLLIFVLAKVFLFKSAQDTRIEFNHHWAANPNRSKSIFSYFGWQPQHHSPLRNPTSISTDHSSSSHHKRHASLLESKAHSLSIPSLQSLILNKCMYDPLFHQPETCEWLNILIAQTIAKYRNDKGFNNRIINMLHHSLNTNASTSSSNLLGPVSITALSLGEEFPLLKGACIRFADHVLHAAAGETPNMRAEIQFEFHDQVSISIDTHLLINWPKPLIAALPVSITLSLVKLSGTLAIEFVSSPQHSPAAHLSISILPQDFLLEFEVRSLLGHRTKVIDLPKLTQMITSRLRRLFMDQIVYPSCKKIIIPALWADAEEIDLSTTPPHSNQLDDDEKDGDGLSEDKGGGVEETGERGLHHRHVVGGGSGFNSDSNSSSLESSGRSDRHVKAE